LNACINCFWVQQKKVFFCEELNKSWGQFVSDGFNLIKILNSLLTCCECDAQPKFFNESYQQQPLCMLLTQSSTPQLDWPTNFNYNDVFFLSTSQEENKNKIYNLCTTILMCNNILTFFFLIINDMDCSLLCRNCTNIITHIGMHFFVGTQYLSCALFLIFIQLLTSSALLKHVWFPHSR